MRQQRHFFIRLNLTSRNSTSWHDYRFCVSPLRQMGLRYYCEWDVSIYAEISSGNYTLDAAAKCGGFASVRHYGRSGCYLYCFLGSNDEEHLVIKKYPLR